MVNLTERAIILEKGKLIKDALRIVDKLARNDLGDIDGDITVDDFDVEKLQKLVLEARKLTRNRWWDV